MLISLYTTKINEIRIDFFLPITLMYYPMKLKIFLSDPIIRIPIIKAVKNPPQGKEAIIIPIVVELKPFSSAI